MVVYAACCSGESVDAEGMLTGADGVSSSSSSSFLCRRRSLQGQAHRRRQILQNNLLHPAVLPQFFSFRTHGNSFFLDRIFRDWLFAYHIMNMSKNGGVLRMILKSINM